MIAPTLAWLTAAQQMSKQLARDAEATRRRRQAEEDRSLAQERSRPAASGQRDLPWTKLADYSRAVKVGSVIEVAGTTAVADDGRMLQPADASAQTQEALRKVGEALAEYGANLGDVVRMRIYLKKAWQWEEVARAQQATFARRPPATTFVGASGLVHPDALVQIEATASIAC